MERTSYDEASRRVIGWARDAEHRYVCAANVHMTMVAFDDDAFRSVVNGADLVTPDGMPLVWMLRLLGARGATRVYGPDLMLAVCEAAAREGVPIGLLGGREETLLALRRVLQGRWPSLDIAYMHAPPFRDVTAEEDARVVEDIHGSGARILFVGLGCPKQERWMADHRDRLAVVQLGVGAAFDFHSGAVAQAPDWIQYAGLEWGFRLLREPRRLWRRYLAYNPRFVGLALLQLLGVRTYT